MAPFAVAQPGLMGRGVVSLTEWDCDGVGLLYEAGENPLSVAFKASRQHNRGFEQSRCAYTEAGRGGELGLKDFVLRLPE